MDAFKEATIETIKKLPDGCTAEDIMYEIDFLANALDGLKDADAGRTITTEELLAKAASWAK